MRGRLAVPLLLVVAAALLALPWPPALAERLYLGALHPSWSALTAGLVDAVEPSLSAVLVLLAVLVPLLALLLGGRRAARGALRFWGVAALTLLLLFPFTFGLGYRLPPLADQALVAGVELDEVTRGALAAKVLATLEASATAAGLDARALAAPATIRAASRCVARTAQALRGGVPPRLPERVKPLPAGLLLRFGFAGVVSPWLLEPHVDASLPPASALAVTLHEFAHTAGYAAEAEAEAVGLLAGIECDEAPVVYAAALRLAGALAASLPADERAEFVAKWPQRARNDAAAAAHAARRFRSAALAPQVEAAYDLYLKSQGDAGGLLEYDRGTELALRLLAARGG